MQDSTTVEPLVSGKDTKAVADVKGKQEWRAPSLQKLDFQQTEAGAGAFSEGTVGGLPSGSLS